LNTHKLLFICLFAITVNSISINSANAKGPSPYLPLKIDPIFELELDRLATLAKLPLLTKPYHAATVNKYLSKVKNSHPALYQRISTYIKRYKKNAAITHFSAGISYSDTKDITLPNQQGQAIDDNYQAAVSGFWQTNEYLIFNAGGSYYQGGDFIPKNTFVSFGWDVFQVDVGYREHWLSPTQEASMLISTQAKPILNVTISNPTLLTDWNIKYEVSIGLLEEQDDIKFGDNPAVSGEPGFLTMHASIQPFDWWTIGVNRTFQFAGDGSNISLGDIWQAIIDPVNSDNCGGGGTELQDCTEEFGNQQASITNKLDLNAFNTDFSLYYEFAGEDTNNYKNYLLGNKAHNLGLFIPYINDKMALNMEYTYFEDAWYVHHIYGEGYSNDGVKMGHWWGTMKHPKDGGAGSAASVRLDWQTTNASQISILYRTASFDDSGYADYQQAHEVEVKFNHILGNAFAGISLYAGKRADGESFFQTGISYTW